MARVNCISRQFKKNGQVEEISWETLPRIAKKNCFRLLGSRYRAITCQEKKWTSELLRKTVESASDDSYWFMIAKNIGEFCPYYEKGDCFVHGVAIDGFLAHYDWSSKKTLLV